jgi:hypothetical protein
MERRRMMKMTRTRMISCVAAALVLLAMAGPADLGAWAQWGPVWSTGDIPVPMEANGSGTPDCSGITEFGALRRAGTTWNQVSCSFFAFTKGPGYPNNRSAPVQDGVNNIVWDYGTGALAVTYLWGWFTRLENDIIFDEGYSWSCSGSPGFNQYDAETVALHEMGHVLALDHSNNFSAVMYAYYQGVRRSLHQDDINGVCALYPAAAAPTFPLEVQDFDF